MEYNNDWLPVAKNITNTELTGLTKHTILMYVCSYLVDPIIISHLLFQRECCNTWYLHFHWQKAVNKKSKVAGFLGCHMAMRYYVQ